MTSNKTKAPEIASTTVPPFTIWSETSNWKTTTTISRDTRNSTYKFRNHKALDSESTTEAAIDVSVKMKPSNSTTLSRETSANREEKANNAMKGATQGFNMTNSLPIKEFGTIPTIPRSMNFSTDVFSKAETTSLTQTTSDFSNTTKTRRSRFVKTQFFLSSSSSLQTSSTGFDSSFKGQRMSLLNLYTSLNEGSSTAKRPTTKAKTSVSISEKPVIVFVTTGARSEISQELIRPPGSTFNSDWTTLISTTGKSKIEEPITTISKSTTATTDFKKIVTLTDLRTSTKPSIQFDVETSAITWSESKAASAETLTPFSDNAEPQLTKFGNSNPLKTTYKFIKLISMSTNHLSPGNEQKKLASVSAVDFDKTTTSGAETKTTTAFPRRLYSTPSKAAPTVLTSRTFTPMTSPNIETTSPTVDKFSTKLTKSSLDEKIGMKEAGVPSEIDVTTEASERSFANGKSDSELFPFPRQQNFVFNSLCEQHNACFTLIMVCIK